MYWLAVKIAPCGSRTTVIFIHRASRRTIGEAARSAEPSCPSRLLA